MLMMLMSLAISLVPVQSLLLLPQEQTGSNQNSQSRQVRQDNRDSATSIYVLNLPRNVSVTPIALPPGDNAWAVQIVSSGGFTGSGKGNLTLTSDGNSYWDSLNGSCHRKVSDETMQALTKTVFAASGTYTVDEPRSSCLDCYVTAMVVTRRRPAENETTFAFSWDDASQAKVARDLINIYQAVMATKECKLQ